MIGDVAHFKDLLRDAAQSYEVVNLMSLLIGLLHHDLIFFIIILECDKGARISDNDVQVMVKGLSVVIYHIQSRVEIHLESQ